MAKVPVYNSEEGLHPTPVDPSDASVVGREVVDLGQGLSGLGNKLQQLQDATEKNKADFYLSKSVEQNYRVASTDPDVFNLDKKILDSSEKSILEASKLIESPQARNEFIEKSMARMEYKNIPILNKVYQRQSQYHKDGVLATNAEELKQYKFVDNAQEKSVIKQDITDRTNESVRLGFIDPIWAKHYLEHNLKQADIDQIKDYISTNPEATYKQLQKGKEGLFPDISDALRKEFSTLAQKQMQKQGTENNYIAEIAQNHAENQLIDRMASNQLTQEDINNAQLMGINGGKIRPEFAQAATEALMDPFPTESHDEKYTQLFNKVTDPDSDPIKTKLDILKTRGVSAAEKAKLINNTFREDPEEGKKTLAQLINEGVANNKKEIMEKNKQIQKEVESKRSFFGRIGSMFSDHAKDDAHLADLQRQFMDKVGQFKTMNDQLNLAKDIMNKDTLKRNPNISQTSEKGTLQTNKISGKKRIYYPDGHFEPVNE